MSKGLKLIALDQEQLAILSSLTQDSIVRLMKLVMTKNQKDWPFL